MTTYAVLDWFVEAPRGALVFQEDPARTSLVTIGTGLTLTYQADLGRVRIAAGGLDGAAQTATVDRSTNGVTWTTVRGGASVDVTSGSLLIYDYEFTPGVETTYRVRVYS